MMSAAKRKTESCSKLESYESSGKIQKYEKHFAVKEFSANYLRHNTDGIQHELTLKRMTEIRVVMQE